MFILMLKDGTDGLTTLCTLSAGRENLPSDWYKFMLMYNITSSFSLLGILLYYLTKSAKKLVTKVVKNKWSKTDNIRLWKQKCRGAESVNMPVK